MSRNMTSFSPAGGALLFATLLSAQVGASAQAAGTPDLAALKLPVPVSTLAPLPTPSPDDQVQVVVRLTDKPLVVMAGANAKRAGSTMTLAQRKAHMDMLKSKQDAVSAQVQALGGTETSRVSKVLNAVVFSTEASTLPQIQRIAGVVSVRPMAAYTIDLSETVPYIGAEALQIAGLTGAGVKVAVLDSGIDYTHKNLGGSGLVPDYTTATDNPAVIPSGLFPTAKVIGGYDFTGSAWTGASGTPPRSSDPNPIDDGPGGGHGTHVADIIGGNSNGTHKGVAPGAQLYAVKVCSSVSTSCNGEAILLGLDWITDPNGDLDFSDAADVVNLSLGSSYGQREDDSTLAVSNVVRFGIVAAISAGNSADRPYIAGSPSTAPEAISVAQTQVPSATVFPLMVSGISPPEIKNTATVEWAPIGGGFSGAVVRLGQGCPANSISAGSPADAYFNGNTPSGKVALIDRGACSVSLKVDRATKDGALAVIIANNAAGDPPSFSFGGGDLPMVPTIIITQADSNRIKTALGPTGVNPSVIASVNLNSSVPLVGGVVGSSSRGPSYSYQQIKPEIGAPGASVSALVGTGNGENAFGGTSGAAPMVAGSAALLLQQFPTASAAEIKSRLMNGANSDIYTNPATLPGELAPITRIGAGEVRVDKAKAITTGLWDATNPYNVGLSFGTLRATGTTTLSKKVAVRNYSNAQRSYTITPSFRYADDAASGAVTLSAPASILVAANSTSAFALTMTVDSSKLPLWNLGFTSSQGNGALLQGVEFDGYISVNDPAGSVSLPWHVLPHKAANVATSTSVTLDAAGVGNLPISNTGGATDGYVDVFALTGASPQITNVQSPAGSQDVLIDLKAAGVRDILTDEVVQFAITTYGQRAHPSYPAQFQVLVDSNADGANDYAIFTQESGAFASTGQTLVFVQEVGATNARAYYYADADLNSANMVLTVPTWAIGITTNNSPQKIKFSVFAFDNYFTGAFKDSITGMTHTLGQPKYAIEIDSFSVPVGFTGSVPVGAVAGGAAASPSQTGFLLIYADAKTGRESDQVTLVPAAP
jgi:subtilisin family serine protease